MRRWINTHFPCLTVNVRAPDVQWHPTMNGVKLSETPAIEAKFGVLGPEYQYESEDGTISTHAAISGGVYDLDQETAEHGWTEEEQQMIVRRLEELEQQPWSGVVRVQAIAAPAPWPKYDETEETDVIGVAELVGADLGAVLAYERENKNRAKLVKALNEHLSQAQIESELTAA